MKDILFNQGKSEFIEGRVLRHSLSNFSNPNKKISELVKSNVLVRVKRDLFIPGDSSRQKPVSREILANLLYKPSYISFDYALMKYGLIPERVRNIASVCLGRSRIFQNSFGLFSYRENPQKVFSLGMSIILNENSSYLIATPEKALLDKIRSIRSLKIRSYLAMEELLFEDLRIYEDSFCSLNANHMQQLARCFNSDKLTLCANLLRKYQGKNTNE